MLTIEDLEQTDIGKAAAAELTAKRHAAYAQAAVSKAAVDAKIRECGSGFARQTVEADQRLAAAREALKQAEAELVAIRRERSAAMFPLEQERGRIERRLAELCGAEIDQFIGDMEAERQKLERMQDVDVAVVKKDFLTTAADFVFQRKAVRSNVDSKTARAEAIGRAIGAATQLRTAGLPLDELTAELDRLRASLPAVTEAT